MNGCKREFVCKGEENWSSKRNKGIIVSGGECAYGVKETLADRFIPLRTYDNLYTEFLSEDSLIENNEKEDGDIEYIRHSEENSKMYTTLLKAHILNEALIKHKANTTNFPDHILRFKKGECKTHINKDLISNIQFSFSYDSNTHHKLPKQPYKILDAPGLKDDFYLNTVDWSSSDILAIGLNTTLYTLKTNLSQVELALEGDNEITAISFNSSGNCLFVGYENGYVQLIDMKACKVISTYSGHSKRITCGSWCNDFLFSTGSQDTRIFDHDTRVSAPFVKAHNGHKREVCNLKWSPDGRFLASGGSDNKVLIWNLSHNFPLYTLGDHSAAVKALAWHPLNKNLLATGGGIADRNIKMWDCMESKCLRSVDTGSQVCNLLFSKDGRELVSGHGYMGNTVSVWNSCSLGKIGQIKAHANRVLHLAMSPNGETVMTGAGDETLKFWKLFSINNKEMSKSSLLAPCMEFR